MTVIVLMLYVSFMRNQYTNMNQMNSTQHFFSVIELGKGINLGGCFDKNSKFKSTGTQLIGKRRISWLFKISNEDLRNVKSKK